jgi:hypothetical protein
LKWCVKGDSPLVKPQGLSGSEIDAVFFLVAPALFWIELKYHGQTITLKRKQVKRHFYTYTPIIAEPFSASLIKRILGRVSEINLPK